MSGNAAKALINRAGREPVDLTIHAGSAGVRKLPELIFFCTKLPRVH